MSDADIDIEEHDLLEHPGVLSAFPDLSVVKQEAPEYYDDDQEIGENAHDEYDKESYNHEENSQTPHTDPSDEVDQNKPDSTTDIATFRDPDLDRVTPSASPLVTSSQSLEQAYESDEDVQYEERCFHSYVQLDNWKSYLDNSKSYCAECKILFATVNDLTAHDMSEHSHLTEAASPIVVSEKKNVNSIHECDKCPATFTRLYNLKKHKVNIHLDTLAEPLFSSKQEKNRVTPVKPVQENTGHLCQVCDTYLASKEELITHLYGHVGHKCDFCNALFSQKSLLEKHLWVHARQHQPTTSRASASSHTNKAVKRTAPSVANKIILGSKTPSKTASPVVKKDQKVFYKCPVCFQLLVSSFAYTQHMKAIHVQMLHEVPESSIVSSPLTRCDPCGKQFTSSVELNYHIRNNHLHGKCPTCGKTFSSHSSLTVHRNMCKQNAKTNPSNLTSNFAYKCLVCNMTFGSYKTGSIHKLKHHPEMQESKIIVRDTQKLIIKKLKAAAKEHDRHLRCTKLTLSKALIHCKPCDVFFVNLYRALRHQCSSRKFNMIKCKVCNRNFASCSMALHAKQHQLGQHKHTILNLHALSANRKKILYRCSDCDLFFNAEESICKHVEDKNTKHWKCELCHLKYGSLPRAFSYHALLHKNVGALNVKDCTVLEYSHSSYDGKKRTKVPASSVSEKTTAAETNDGKGEKVTLVKKRKRHLLALMECHHCKKLLNKVHFQSDVGACRKKDFTVCLLCGLSFTKKSIKQHKKLHAMHKKPLKLDDFIITSTKDSRPVKMTVARAMKQIHRCKCGVMSNFSPVCLGNSNCAANSVYCQECDLKFTKTAYEWHMKFHKNCEEKPRMGGTISTPIRGLKPRVTKERPSKLPADLCFYRCVCKLHFTNKLLLERHYIYCMRQQVYVCVRCGLTSSCSAHSNHKKLHKLYGDFRFKDLKILDLKGEPVGREKCNFPKCSKCDVSIIGLDDYHNKTCDKDPVIKHCKKCKMTFSNRAFDLHLPYYGCDEAYNNKVQPNQLKPQQQPKKIKLQLDPSDSEVTKLISSYNKLDEIWTQLYQCDDCEVILDSYDEVVRHCVEHQSPGYEVAAFVCHVCDLNFDYSSFQRHKEQHYTRPGLNRGRFEVVEFKPSRYNKADWSTYKDAFIGFKGHITLKQSGLEQHTLYQCLKCKRFCDNRIAAYHHSKQEKSCSGPSNPCVFCGLVIDKNCEQSHLDHHKQNPDLAENSFRIFWFFNDNKETEESNEHLKLFRNTLFKCSLCNVHFLKRWSLMEHYKNHSKHCRKATCKQCGLIFPLKAIGFHKRSHHDRENFSRDDFDIQVVENTYVPVKKEPQNSPKPTLYRCVCCDIHFLSLEMSNQHVEFRKCNLGERVACSHCNLGFRKSVIDKHVKKHHEQLNLTALDFSVQDVMPKAPKRTHSPKKRTVNTQVTEDKCSENKQLTAYRCSGCKALAFSEEKMNKHFEEKYEFFNLKCDKCKLTFICHYSLSTHYKNHKNNKNLKASDYNITSMHRPDDECVNVKVFKCGACEICFMKYSSLEKHIYMHKKQVIKNSVTCECGLQFSELSYKRHRNYHHDSGMDKLQVVTLKTEGGRITRGEIEEISLIGSTETKLRIFECSVCQALALSIQAMMEHFTKKDGFNCSDCDQCGLKFVSKHAVSRHKLLHHGDNNLDMSDYDIIEKQRPNNKCANGESKIKEKQNAKIDSDSKLNSVKTSDVTPTVSKRKLKSAVVNKTGNTVDLYKCWQCDRHCLSLRAAEWHIFVSGDHKEKLKICEYCHLQFSNQIMSRHVQRHHRHSRPISFKIFTVDEKMTMTVGNVVHMEKSNRKQSGNNVNRADDPEGDINESSDTKDANEECDANTNVDVEYLDEDSTTADHKVVNLNEIENIIDLDKTDDSENAEDLNEANDIKDSSKDLKENPKAISVKTYSKRDIIKTTDVTEATNVPNNVDDISKNSDNTVITMEEGDKPQHTVKNHLKCDMCEKTFSLEIHRRIHTAMDHVVL